jgi:ABC-type transporter Mla subunit MlaD
VPARKAPAAKKPAAEKKAPARRKAAPRATVEAVPDTVLLRLEAVVAALQAALAEVPRASEFEPLAEHLYEFARTAPTLRAAAEPVEAAVRTLQEVSETLTFTQESFAESILSLPTAQEYEPLIAPLSEFARVAPDLAVSLRGILSAAAPMHETARRLDDAARAMVARPSARSAGDDAWRVEAAAARDEIRSALDGLPRDEDYARVAGQLRELATVSPSLMEWLTQVGTVSAPLQSSVARLGAAADRLDRLLSAAASGPSRPR